MLTAPFERTIEGTNISVSSLAFSNDYWKMDSSDTIRGVSHSLLWCHHQETTAINGKSLTGNFTFILRNQSDYSNVIIILSTLSAKVTFPESKQTLLRKMAELLYLQAERYVSEAELKGNDEASFVLPEFNFTDSYFNDWV